VRNQIKKKIMKTFKKWLYESFTREIRWRNDWSTETIPRGLCCDPAFCCQIHQYFTHVFFANILVSKITKLCFRFEIFWCKNIGNKSACKMLMKFTPVVKFTNILWAIFCYFLLTKHLRTQSIFVSGEKLRKNTSAQKKMYVKCW